MVQESYMIFVFGAGSTSVCSTGVCSTDAVGTGARALVLVHWC